MSTATLDMVTPAPEERERTARVVSFVDAHLALARAAQTSSPTPAPTPDFYLSGPDQHDRVELTEPLFRILKDVAGALSQGQSVSIVARDKEISTQQAADMLGISRPTVVKLIEQGELPATIPGEQRRKLRLTDVLAYRDRLYEARSNFIAESSQAYDDVDPDETAALVATVRKAH